MATIDMTSDPRVLVLSAELTERDAAAMGEAVTQTVTRLIDEAADLGGVVLAESISLSIDEVDRDFGDRQITFTVTASGEVRR